MPEGECGKTKIENRNRKNQNLQNRKIAKTQSCEDRNGKSQKPRFADWLRPTAMSDCSFLSAISDPNKRSFPQFLLLYRLTTMNKPSTIRSLLFRTTLCLLPFNLYFSYLHHRIAE
jgi:hypothetical protein